MVLAGIKVPDTVLVRDAIDLSRSVSEPFLFNHVMRSWLFGVLLSESAEPAPDAELLAVATVLHDLGLTDRYMAENRFEVDGANAARSFLKGRGISTQQMQVVSAALFTPKEAAPSPSLTLSKEEVEHYINALDKRERVIALLAIFAGMRPGEILALQRRHVSGDCNKARIEQRIYRGDIDTPKTTNSARTVAIPSKTATAFKEWMELVPGNPEAWIFASENPSTPLWRDNVWRRHMQPRLKSVGLEWATFQVLRRTHASLGHDAGIDPKVAADQRGHGIGVAIDVCPFGKPA